MERGLGEIGQCKCDPDSILQSTKQFEATLGERLSLFPLLPPQGQLGQIAEARRASMRIMAAFVNRLSLN